MSPADLAHRWGWVELCSLLQEAAAGRATMPDTIVAVVATPLERESEYTVYQQDSSGSYFVYSPLSTFCGCIKVEDFC